MWEAGKVRKYQEQLEKNDNKKENENNKESKDVEDMDVMNKRLADKAMNKNNNNEDIKNYNEDNECDELTEPIPRAIHKFCHICTMKYDNYLDHIKSFEHFENLKRHRNFFNRVKKTFENINIFWTNKKEKKEQ